MEERELRDTAAPSRGDFWPIVGVRCAYRSPFYWASVGYSRSRTARTDDSILDSGPWTRDLAGLCPDHGKAPRRLERLLVPPVPSGTRGARSVGGPAAEAKGGSGSIPSLPLGPCL